MVLGYDADRDGAVDLEEEAVMDMRAALGGSSANSPARADLHPPVAGVTLEVYLSEGAKARAAAVRKLSHVAWAVGDLA